MLIGSIPTDAGTWFNTLANYGIAGLWISWFISRDRTQSKAADKKHSENIAAIARLTLAFTTALREEREYFAEDIAYDRKVRHKVADALGALNYSLQLAGLQIVKPPPSAAADDEIPM